MHSHTTSTLGSLMIWSISDVTKGWYSGATSLPGLTKIHLTFMSRVLAAASHAPVPTVPRPRIAIFILLSPDFLLETSFLFCINIYPWVKDTCL